MMRLWVNGKLLDDPSAPAVSPVDHGLTVGDGAFETIKVTAGRPFALTRHLERLRRSAVGLGLPEPDLDLVRKGVDEVIGEWTRTHPAGRLRITYTCGPAPLGSERAEVTPTTVIGITELEERPVTTAVATVPWPRNERGARAGLKTTSYAENVVALAHAVERGASEALFANTKGELCEGTGSNVFVVLGGRLLTPPLSSGCLAGVTRALVLEWCGAEEADLPMDALTVAEEIFLTSTTRDVQGVHAVDGRAVGTPGTPGPRTAEALERFVQRAAQDHDPA
ncbi:MAG TPA: aminotransferase class IV [Actinopolymorphaceae bacterium]